MLDNTGYHPDMHVLFLPSAADGTPICIANEILTLSARIFS